MSSRSRSPRDSSRTLTGERKKQRRRIGSKKDIRFKIQAMCIGLTATRRASSFLRRMRRPMNSYVKHFTIEIYTKRILLSCMVCSKEKIGVIDFAIGRSRRDFRLRSAQPKAKGRLREALTRYEVIGESEGYSLLKMSPETGRTHQIRVHLKAIHHPIVGDSLYAPNHPLALGISRLGLHAYSLDLPLPSGERALITAPIPSDLAPAFSYFPSAKKSLLSSSSRATVADTCRES